MIGQVLYLMYAKFQNEQNTIVDAWDELDQSERDVWDKLAAWISETGD